MRILLALPGLHAVPRGAEVAFTEVGSGLARLGHEVTLIGSGPAQPGRPYRYLQGSRIARERFESFPRLPLFRSDLIWEEASFVPSLLRLYKPADYDVTVTCAYPLTNWALRRPVLGARRPPHVYVTQNGDWPTHASQGEFRFFGCDGLVCINPDFFERNRHRYRCALIPNGVDTARFTPGPPERARFGLPEDVPVVLMVSAMIASKNVAEGIRAVSRIPDARLVVAGDGPLRAGLQALADELMPGRYLPVSLASADMPRLYRSVDAFLHLSRDESFGNVYVEALACGVPVVAYDLARTRWIVGDEAILAGDDAASVAAALARAMQRTGPSRSAIERAAEFDWSRVAASYSAFLEEIVAAWRDGIKPS